MDYIVPILGAITAFLAGVAAWRRVDEASKNSAARRWQTLADGLLKRVEDLEFDRDADKHEIDAHLKRIRELESNERTGNERLLSLERDHASLGDEHRALKAEHATLKTRFSRLERRVDYYRKGVALLIEQILEHGLEPAWKPTEEESE